jgi:hypothetical protein
LKKANILFLSLFTFVGCSIKDKTNEDNQSIIIDFENIETTQEKDFFELFQLDTLIELEFKEDFYLSDLYRVVVAEDVFYALDPNFGNLIRFTSDGKILNRISEKGDGPEEMPEVVDFAYDRENDELILASYSALKISRFKPTGEFVSSIRAKEQMDQLAFSSSNLALSMTYYNSLYRNLALISAKGDTLKTFFPFPKDVFPIMLKFISGHLTSSIESGFLFSEPASSKIYALDSEGGIYSKYQFLARDEFWPEENKHFLNDFFQKLTTGELSFLSRFYEETDQYLFFNINKKKTGLRPQIVDPRIGYYDPLDKVVRFSKSDESLLWIKGPIAAEGDKFYAWISKSKLNDLALENSFWRKSLLEYPNLLINDSGDYDTPVLVRFKVAD